MKILNYIMSLPVRVLITVFFVLFIVLVGLIWGVRMAFKPDEPSPTTTVTPNAPLVASPTAVTPVLPAAISPTPPATVPPPATSTPMSQVVPTSVPVGQAEETVQSGEGLYMVCRRHCSGRWPPDDDALATYAQDVAELNGLSWPSPALSPGQSLRMPACPP